MYLSRLHLEEFRNYRTLELSLEEIGLRLVGQNGSGKTSLLESIVMLATTRSPRASTDRELVEWESGEMYGVAPYTRLEATVRGLERERDVAVTIELDRERDGVAKKGFILDGKPVRAHDLIGVIKFVLFSPEDVQLVTGPPAERRRQLDILISQIDREYLRALARYGRVVAQRNGLLKSFARDRMRPDSINAITQLTFWDEQLVGAGAYVIASRLRYVERLSGLMQERSSVIIRDAVIDLAYVSKLDLGAIAENESRDDVQLLTQIVAARFHDQLAIVRPEEFRRGVTAIGPHRDDVMFGLNGRDLATYGSRGQQRLGVVAIKLAEGELIHRETGETPILMLDDVLSELDEAHRDLLLQAVAGRDRQLIVTSTEHAPLDHPSLHYLPMIDVEAGKLG